MKWFKILVAVSIVVVAGAAFPYLQAYWKGRNHTEYREVALSKGSITLTVNSTGTVQPVRRVQVGSRVSGIIEKILVDYNSVVKKGDLMARVDADLRGGGWPRRSGVCHAHLRK